MFRLAHCRCLFEASLKFQWPTELVHVFKERDRTIDRGGVQAFPSGFSGKEQGGFDKWRVRRLLPDEFELSLGIRKIIFPKIKFSQLQSHLSLGRGVRVFLKIV